MLKHERSDEQLQSPTQRRNNQVSNIHPKWCLINCADYDHRKQMISTFGTRSIFRIVPLMAQLKSDDSIFTLDEAELSTFLKETDDKCAVDPTPVTPPAWITSKSKAKQPRRSYRADIMNTRLAIVELERQLQALHKKNEFRKSFTAGGSMDWTLSVSRAQLQIKTARKESARLRKRVDTNVELIQRVSKLMHLQMETMPKPARIDHRFVEIDDKARIYRVRQACLDIRSTGQLDAVVTRCNDVLAGSELQTLRWNTFALEGGVGVEYHESVVMPFSSSLIVDAVHRHSSMNAVEIFPNNKTKVSVSDQHLVVRRLAKKSDRSFLLWEDASCWQSDVNSVPLSVRGSGWAFITPVADHAEELSVIHSGGIFQIYTADGSSLNPSDALVQEIVAYKQSLQRSRVATLEDILICSKFRPK